MDSLRLSTRWFQLSLRFWELGRVVGDEGTLPVPGRDAPEDGSWDGLETEPVDGRLVRHDLFCILVLVTASEASKIPDIVSQKCRDYNLRQKSCSD